MIEVSLKSGLSDPEAETSAESLRDLGYKVSGVNISKLYYVDLEADSKEDVEELADEMCKRLLANPVKDNYKIEVR